MDQAIRTARTAHANYSYEVVNNVVCIRDEGGARSVTNDAEAVIADLIAAGVDMVNQPVIYRDPDGAWDELVVKDGQFTDFRFLRTRDQTTASNRATLRAIAERTQYPNNNAVFDRIGYNGAELRLTNDQVVMEGPTGRHTLYRNVSDIARIAAHWNTFCYVTDRHQEPEQHRAAVEIARAYVGTLQARRESYSERTRSYDLDYRAAADVAGVPAALREPVVVLVATAYSETHQWAIGVVRDEHLSALQQADGNDAKYQAAIARLKSDPAVTVEVAEAIAVALPFSQLPEIARRDEGAALTAIAQSNRALVSVMRVNELSGVGAHGIVRGNLSALSVITDPTSRNSALEIIGRSAAVQSAYRTELFEQSPDVAREAVVIHHVAVLHHAQTAGEFHTAFESLKADPAVTLEMAGAIHQALTDSPPQQWTSLEAVHGAIETARHHDAQQTLLREYGLDEFDAWAATYGEIVSQVELAPSGQGFRATRSFTRFVNLPELVTLYGAVSDTQTADMLNLSSPQLKGGGIQIVECEMSPFEAAIMEQIEIARRDEGAALTAIAQSNRALVSVMRVNELSGVEAHGIVRGNLSALSVITDPTSRNSALEIIGRSAAVQSAYRTELFEQSPDVARAAVVIHHVAVLQHAQTAGEFHTAFESLKADPAVTLEMAGAIHQALTDSAPEQCDLTRSRARRHRDGPLRRPAKPATDRRSGTMTEPVEPVLSNDIADLDCPGVIVVFDPDVAEAWGAFLEDALDEGAAWSANDDVSLL